MIRLEAEATQITRIIGEILLLVEDGEEIASPETCLRFARILLHMQQDVPGVVMQQAFASLVPEAQSVVNSVMEGYRVSQCKVVTP